MFRFITCAVLIGITFVSCQVFQNRKYAKATAVEAQQKESDQARRTAIREKLASSHNAFVVSEKALSELEYTIQFQRALISTNHQPVLFTATLQDVYQENGTTLVHLAHETKQGIRISFELECDEQSAQSLLRKERGRARKYFVVAHCTTVSSPKFEASSLSLGDMAFQEEDGSQVLIVRGKCLDLRRADILVPPSQGREMR